MLAVTLTTNIEQIKARLRLLEGRVLVACLEALDVDFWKKTLAASADAVLKAEMAVAAQGNPELLHRFDALRYQAVKGIMGDLYESGAWFRLTMPHWFLDQAGVAPDLKAAVDFNSSLYTPKTRQRKKATDTPAFELEHNSDFANLEHVRQLILDWVTYEKDLDPERDFTNGAPKSPEELAENIMSILGVAKYGEQRTQLMDDACDHLVGAIQAWIEHKDTTPGGHQVKTTPEYVRSQQVAEAKNYGEYHPKMDPALAEKWLRLVLDAWVQTARDVLPGRLKAQFAKVRQEMGTK